VGWANAEEHLPMHCSRLSSQQADSPESAHVKRHCNDALEVYIQRWHESSMLMLPIVITASAGHEFASAGG